MRYKLLCTCVLLAFAVMAVSAQTKQSLSGKCGKAENAQSVPAGDKDGHMFIVEQGKCTSTAGEVGGAKSKDGAFSEHGEATPTHIKVWGVFTETYDSGDKIFYNYQNTAMTKDGSVVSGEGKYQISGGTGKMKGIKGMGTCALKGNESGLDYTCTGEYTLAAAK